ncbi:MAG: LPXTG cell wall anchor domain-containing protein [Oscillospiraceae bacterium]|nr:LPXTG cell wall anchor domain-containing protein [Oscillospiraceae bacterium]
MVNIGGIGTAIFTVTGGIMTALAGAILTLKKRKEHV